MQKYKILCVSFDRYMKIEKGVVDVFWIIMIVFSVVQ